MARFGSRNSAMGRGNRNQSGPASTSLQVEPANAEPDEKAAEKKALLEMKLPLGA